jgi:hypothetical protein
MIYPVHLGQHADRLRLNARTAALRAVIWSASHGSNPDHGGADSGEVADRHIGRDLRQSRN